MRRVDPGLSRDGTATFLSALLPTLFSPSFHKYLLGPDDAMVLGTVLDSLAPPTLPVHLPDPTQTD